MHVQQMLKLFSDGCKIQTRIYCKTLCSVCWTELFARPSINQCKESMPQLFSDVFINSLCSWAYLFNSNILIGQGSCSRQLTARCFQQFIWSHQIQIYQSLCLSKWIPASCLFHVPPSGFQDLRHLTVQYSVEVNS